MRAGRFAGGRRGRSRRLAGSGLLTAGLVLAIPAVAVAALTGGGATGTGLPAVRSQSLTVTTADGAVFGRTTGTVDQWLGIPYAAPPAGRLRWAPPRPVTPWRGVRSALAYGNRCPQLADTNGPLTATMNCLNLNVSAPAVIPAGGRLPVLFMIFGGRLVNGAGDQYDGSLIAQDEHMVVVSFNYRVGPFGFLTLPGLTSAKDAADGNFGLLDTEAALRWVQRNIGAFGGDASRVTMAAS